MRVFITGASGWIGSATTAEFLAAGHEVVGLARTDAAAARLQAAGAAPHRGSLDDLDSLRAGAESADAVVHLAFKHDFDNFAASGISERAAVEAFGEVLAGSDRVFAFASGVAGFVGLGRPTTEDDRTPFVGPEAPRGGGENLALGFAERGIRPVSLRFSPTVHGTGGDHGFVAVLVNVARERGVAAYIGDGSNRWPAVHRLDAARMNRLAVEQAPAGASVAHAVGEEGILTREIAEAIGRGLGLPVVSIAPEQAAEHFGWIGAFFGMEVAASSAQTQARLGWTPDGPTLFDDLAAGAYFPVA